MPRTKKTLFDTFLLHRPFLKGVAFRYAPERSCVDDVLQQVFLEFLKKSTAQELSNDVLPLLVSMTKNIALRQWREHTRKQPDALQAIAQVIQERAEQNGVVYFDEEAAVLEGCLAALPAQHREMIQRYYFDGLTIRELAESFGMKRSTACHTLFRIRENLKSMITDKLNKKEPS